jgi:trehalose utilization protein
MSQSIRVTVWNEFRHERSDEEVRKIYPEGIHRALAGFLSQQPGMQVRTATLDEPEQGLGDSLLAATDVLLWWGHQAHGEVADEVVARIRERVLAGMGLIVLHSAHESKIFKALMGTGCSLKWREAGERERLWCIEPEHPIAAGVGEFIDLPHTEMYGERFDIPAPDEVVFISWFEGGEVFRSGSTFQRGRGKIFYFRPGHETYPIYANQQVQQVLNNAVRWAAPGTGVQ